MSRNVQEPTLTMSRPYRDDFGILLDMEQRYYFTKTIFIETDAAAILKTALSLFGEELYKDISCDFLVVEYGLHSFLRADPRALIYAYDFDRKPMFIVHINPEGDGQIEKATPDHPHFDRMAFDYTKLKPLDHTLLLNY
ncbi:hypothetical protein ONZ45_g17427 [Pleurotus djamor]|nr:hypothetical protein ONZ45_g17427 [Pleurotus djamor]